MKAKVMLLKVVAVIAICAAVPHGVANWENSKGEDSILVEKSKTKVLKKDRDTHQNKEQPIEVENQNTLLGFWEIEYRDPTVKVVYELKEEQGVIKGYSVQLEDENGNTMRDNTLAILVNSVSEKTAKANYFMEYEGEKYEVNCQLEVEANQLVLTYSYFGFDETEVWHKTTQP